ncbi:MAG: hypothetical protein EOP22_12265 [Hyphomicrobiales bacterium]|nr:MAG: hypothetical protein EOP22_12265 [Hyphomicrobiales bacterium]
MTLNTALKNGLRAGLVAVVMAGTAVAGVAPVQAQSNSNFGFSLNFGNGGFGMSPRGGITLQFGDRDYFRYCLSNSKIRAELRDNGYRNVQIVRESNNTNKVWAVGQKRGNWYSMRVDRCSGKVDRIREIERNRNGSFNLRFSFN